MKKIVFILLFFMISCTTTRIVEVPVEVTKTEYKDRLIHDSIYVKENTNTSIRNDTVFETKYLYKYIQKTDTIKVIKTDSIPKIVKVETVKEVNKLKSWQIVLMVMGGGFIVLLLTKIRRLIK